MSNLNISEEIKRFEKAKDELSTALNIAIGYRSVSQFAHNCRMTDSTLIKKILHKQITVLPEREVLRVIERASQGRVTFTYLCQICEYPKYDPNEDRSWANYCPERGSIYMVDLGWNNMDSEQSGIRPCLVISNDTGNEKSSIITIAPLTTKDKRPMPTHVRITTNDGLRQNSLICLEQVRTISKRRLFYNGVPIKVLNLSEEKIFEVNTAIEKAFGLIDCLFDNDVAFELVEQIEVLREINKNTKGKQSKGLTKILDRKNNALVTYCKKHHRSIDRVINDYERSESIACAI